MKLCNCWKAAAKRYRNWRKSWARSEKTIPIPGFKTVAQGTENAEAMQFGPLTAGQLREINDILNRSTTTV